MIDRYGSGLTPQAWSSLTEELQDVHLTPVKDGSGHPGKTHAGGWIYGLWMTRLYQPTTGINRLWTLPFTRHTLYLLQERIGGELQQIMLNRLAPFTALDKHADGPPSHKRYHLPIATSPLCVWWDEQHGEFHMKERYWHGPVPYCGVLHSMSNRAPDVHRLHLVADFN